MVEDNGGFLFPYINIDTCIECHKCEKTCPVLLPYSRPDDATYVYAAQLKNKEELLEVSSGGAFWALAQSVLDSGGVVYGAAQLDINHVQHIRCISVEEARILRRSKYLPSDIGGIYEQVKADLDSHLNVLFSGTGCQIAGLLAFLNKDYDNLTTCDVVCHGIPSMKVWQSYLAEKEHTEKRKMVDVVFRNKSNGWRDNHYMMTYDDGSVEYCPSVQHPFHKGYLKGLFSRLSCSTCPSATLDRITDITLADYWQYKGERFNPMNGISLVCTHSSKGEMLLQRATKYMEYEPTTIEEAIASCHHLTHAPAQHPKREAFFAMLDKYSYKKASEMCLNKQENPIIKILKRIYSGCKKLVRYKYVKTVDEDKQVIKQYYADLGKKAFFAESYIESWRILFCRGDVLVSSNEILRKIAECLKIKDIVNPVKITTIAQQYAALKEALLLLHRKNVPVFFYHRVGKEEGFSYSESGLHRAEKDLSFPKMYENIDMYMSEFRELMGKDVTKEYIENIGKITQIIKKGKYLCHEDITSPHVNVIEGKRITVYQPAQNTRTIHVYGRCGAFGYAVEDKDTLPSQLQLFINESRNNDIKVINHGLWGGEDKNIDHNFLLDMLGMKEGDIVLFYRHHFAPRLMEQLERRGMWYRDITHEWHQYPEATWCYYNYPGHMNAVGYHNAAEIICKDLLDHKFACRPIDEAFANLQPKSDGINYYLKMHTHNEEFDKEITAYVEQIKAQYPITASMQCGAIVMNCNPFTFGHRYLIETASKQVDRLYIFVVEEDKSFFKFADRIEMVRNGTADLQNVCVVPSGNFIISAFTFPEYFMKDYVKEKNFDMSQDVEIFGDKIAPALHIRKRFAGEEPFDVVTARYNETMREVLPKYGLEFVEIPRKSTDDHVVINATLVRELLKEHKWDELRLFVPDSTLNILQERYNS